MKPTKKSVELVTARQHEIRSRKEIQAIIEPAYRYVYAVAGGAVVTGALVASVITYLTDFQYINSEHAGADSLWANAVAVGVMSLLVLSILATVATVASFSWMTNKHARYLDQHHWRPRLGFRHPEGRTDTEPRWEVIRTVTDTITLRLARWEYHHGQWRECSRYSEALNALTRKFTLEELEEAQSYSNELIHLGEHAYAQAEVESQVAQENAQAIEHEHHARAQLAQQWARQQPLTTIAPVRQSIDADAQATQLPPQS